MKLNKFKIDPISLFSHELKTPVSSLKLGLDILNRSPQSEKNKEIIDLMNEELNRLIGFISNQLDLKILEQKKDLIELDWQSWDKLLADTLKSLHLIAQKKQISFKVQNKTNKSFEVFADATWLAKALTNILANALKFSSKNSKIFINYELTNKGFKCSIKDQGVGLSQEQQKTLFKNFKASNKKTENDKVFLENTGLGLLIVRDVIAGHGGFLEVKSDGKNQGTVISFYLPKFREFSKSA